jgi:hypothetical protein
VTASETSVRGLRARCGARWRAESRSDNVCLSGRLRGELSGSGGSYTRPGGRSVAVRLHPEDAADI